MAFDDAVVNAGDMPLLEVSNLNTTLMHVEVVEAIKGSAPFVHEVQQLTVSGSGDGMTAGMFDVSFGGDRSPPLSFNASSTDLVAALAQLPSIRDGVTVSNADDAEKSWRITFASAGPQEMMTSSCETTSATNVSLSLDCLLEHSTVEIRRLVRGSSPASGTFRLQLVRADGVTKNEGADVIRTTVPLRVDSSAEEVQNALVALRGGAEASVSVAPNLRVGYGREWAVALNDNGVHSVKLVDVHVRGPAPWCADGSTGPAVTETPCEFPFTVDQDGGTTHFECAGVGGSSMGWCSTSPVFQDSQDWGGCARCSAGALAPPNLHVASRRRRFHLIGSSADVSRALSEVSYHPRPYWNAWLGGLDEVYAYWHDENSPGIDETVSGAKARTKSQVFVAPINDPPTLNIPQQHVLVYEGQEVLLEGADIGDPDLIERPEIVIQVSVEAQLGTLALGDPDDLMFFSGTPEPHSSGQLVIKGKLSNIQSAVKQLYYRPPGDFAAGAASSRAAPEIQRIELAQPIAPMVQSITTSAVEGYIEGNFTLALKCDAFFEPLKEIFPDADLFNDTVTDSYSRVAQSPPLAADAPASGNASVEVGIRAMLTDCYNQAWNQSIILAEEFNATSPGNSSSTDVFSSEILPHSAATAVVARGDPDLHGCISWAVTLIDVPESLPAFDVVSQNLTVGGTGASETPYVYGVSSSSLEPSMSVVIIEVGSSSSSLTGTFTLALIPGGEATQAVPASASGEELALALSALADVGAVQVSTGSLLVKSPGVPSLGRYWQVTFLSSGSPPHAGDLPVLIADDAGLRNSGGVLRVSEVTKGRAPMDTVSIVVDDLGNVGSGESLDVAASWSVTIVPQESPPTVRIYRKDGESEFLRGFEGGVVYLPAIEIHHAVAWTASMKDGHHEVQYVARLSCSRGMVKPASSRIRRHVNIDILSPTVTELIGTLSDLNHALAQVIYSVPTRYRGADSVTVEVRMAGAGIGGGSGSSTLYILVDGSNRAPELAAPRSMRTVGMSPMAVEGIRVSDDDVGGIMALNVEAVRGVVSIPDQQLHRLVDVTKVRIIGMLKTSSSLHLNTRKMCSFLKHRLVSMVSKKECSVSNIIWSVQAISGVKGASDPLTAR